MKSLTVTRLQKYPKDEPTGWAVGFVCECDNGRTFYNDTIVSFDDADDDDGAVNVALANLEEVITLRCEGLESKSELLGSDVADRLSSH